MKYDKYEVREVEALRRIVNELATAQTAGLDVQLKRLIREARKSVGVRK